MSLKAQQARVQQAEQALQAHVAETSSQARQLAACWHANLSPGRVIVAGLALGSRAPAAMGWKRWCLDNTAQRFAIIRRCAGATGCGQWCRHRELPPCAIVRPAPDAGLQ
jgi:hypothetical protein